MSEVTAIVVGATSAPRPLLDGVTAQVPVSSLSDISAAAHRSHTALVWLLDAGAQPLEGTLAALLQHAPGPVVSLPVDAGGAPLARAVGRIEDAESELVLASAAEGTVPLRHAPIISLLAARHLVASLDPPATKAFGDQAGAEWTARLFAVAPGRLVTDSRIVARPVPSPTAAQTLRLARAGVLGRRDTVRQLGRALGRPGVG